MTKEKGDNLSSSAIKTALGNLGSRLTGFLRDVLFASYFGTSGVMSAFLTALTFPNLGRRIFGEGALTSSFIPLLSDKLKNEKDIWAFSSIILSITVILTSFLALAGIIICTAAAFFIGDNIGLIFKLTSWMLPYMIFICLSALMSGILNLLKSFSLPALSSTFLNIFLISGCLLGSGLTESTENKILILAIAVVISGIFQSTVLLRALKKKGAGLKWKPDFQSDEWLSVKKLFIPAILGASVAQLSVLSDRLIANFIGSHAVSALYYSERLTYFPVGIFGVALGAACLPFMSRAVSNEDHKELMSAFSFGMRQVIFLTVPCTAIFFLYHTDILIAVFKRGAFDSKSLLESSKAFMFYLPGIPAFAAVKIILPLYYAKKDTRTPVRVAIFCLAVNLLLGLSLIPVYQHGSLALATTVSSYMNIFLLIRYSSSDILHTLKGIVIPALRILASTFLACLITELFNWESVQGGGKSFGILLCKAGCCSSLFILFNALTGGRELIELLTRNKLN